MPHFPTHLRRSFYAWIEQGMPPAASVEVDYKEEVWPAERLLGVMCHSSDVMPSAICELLGIERGSSCARAAQRLLAERRRTTGQRPRGGHDETRNRRGGRALDGAVGGARLHERGRRHRACEGCGEGRGT
jgi:hypothetical protein